MVSMAFVACAPERGEGADRGGENPLLAATWINRASVGTIVETSEVSTYTYLRVHAGGERYWAVISEPLPAGTECVSLTLYASLARYTSPRTGRTFAPLYFASARAPGAEEETRCTKVSD